MVTPSSLNVDNMTFDFLSWQSTNYQRIASSLYPFFSRHADRHYTDATLNSLTAIPAMLTENNVDRLHREAPVIGIASMPYSYDEESEVKVGGTTGLMVVFPNSGFKAVLAVHKDARLIGVGRNLWNIMSYRTPRANFWVHRRNFDGQRFLLSMGFFPTGMNVSGSIRYSLREEDE